MAWTTVDAAVTARIAARSGRDERNEKKTPQANASNAPRPIVAQSHDCVFASGGRPPEKIAAASTSTPTITAVLATAYAAFAANTRRDATGIVR